MNKKEYSGVWIPKEVLNIDIKNGNAKILFAMIISLSNKAPCSASNKYFSELLQLSKGQISRLISNLEVKGFIKTFTDDLNGCKRTITIDTNAYTLYANKPTGISNSDDTLYANMPINSIEDNIYIKTTTTTEKIKNNFKLIKSICRDKNITQDALYKQIEAFSQFLVNTQKEIHKTDNDLFSHFLSWLKSYKPVELFDEKNEEPLKWFIKMFNDVSKKDFKISESIKQNFAKQFAVGFSGDEMRLAVMNLYSSKPANKFHIDSCFKFATPEYVLKGDNLNKYLNVSYANRSIVKMKRIG
jgi:hypothetical protein